MTDPNAVPQHRYRIQFGKVDDLRYTSHLDVARLWERVFRRANFSLVYSQGFNPRPKIQLAMALPLGFASTAEVVDMWLNTSLDDLDAALSALQDAAPVGLEIYAIKDVPLRGPALQSISSQAVYRFEVEQDIDSADLHKRMDNLMAEKEIFRERRGKEYDLRPLILSLELISSQPLQFEAALAVFQQGGTGRADELVDALGLDVSAVRITRIGMEFSESTA